MCRALLSYLRKKVKCSYATTLLKLCIPSLNSSRNILNIIIAIRER
uniref:Uncharacterized protein n=1 Tax=Anguilla anguilla TaxID=7936 RepID=A0A0E9R8Q6_ANGAN